MTAEATATRSAGRAWLVWALGAICFTYAFVHRVAPSVMVEDLMRDFAVGGALLGNLSAVYFYTYAGLQIPVGLIVDRWGPRRVLTVAILVSAVGSLLFSTAESLTLAYLGRLLIGAGVAFGFVGTLALVSNWFSIRRFAMMSGLTMLVGLAGGILGQAPMAPVVEALGWRATVLWIGLVGVALAVFIWLIVRDRPAGTDTGDHRGLTGSEVMAGLGRVLRNRQTWIIALFSTVMSATLLTFGSLWGVPYLMQVHDLSRPAAAFTASLVLIGWAMGGPFSGWLSDHFRRRKAPMVAGALLGLVTITAVLYVPGLPLIAMQALLVVNGAAGSFMVISYAAAREHNPGPSSGAVLGFTNMASTMSGAVLQPFVGWLLDRNWDGAMVSGARVYSAEAYETALLTLPACFAIALVTALFIRETHCKPVA